MDVSKYRALFIEDAREHLAQLERLLVQVEAVAEPSPLIDEMLRHAHSIKGMAATMGYDPITTLAHRLEDVFGEGNAAHGRFDSPTINLLLQGTDALGRQVEAIANGGELSADYELLRRLKAASERNVDHTSTSTNSTTSTKTGRSQAAGQESAASPAAFAGPAIEVCISLSAGCSAPSVRAFLLHRKLSGIATIVECHPSFDDIRAGAVSTHTLRFMLAGKASRADIERVLSFAPDVESIDIIENSVSSVPQSVPSSSSASPPFLDRPAAAVANEVGIEIGSRSAAQAAVTIARISSESESVISPMPVPQGLVAASGPAVVAPGTALATVRVRTNLLDELLDTVRALFIERERLRNLLKGTMTPEVRVTMDAMAGQLRAMHEQVMAVRMMPMRTLTDRLPRVVRDLCQALGKSVELVVEGADIDADRAVLDALDAPLVHLVRNAIDHGVEAPAERVERGKSSIGRLVIHASRDRDAVVLGVTDDGRGVDVGSLKRRAVERGVLTAMQADALADDDALFLMCEPGLSTRRDVTDISGRGVGMDVVRDQVDSLGGTMEIASTLGAGTRFTLRMPLTLALMQALIVETAGSKFAVAVSKVVGVSEDEEAVRTGLLTFRDERVPVVRLAELLRLSASEVPRQILLIDEGVGLRGVAVGRIVASQEVVVKALGEPLSRIECFSGVTVLGDGQPVLIVDPARAMRARATAAA